MHITKKLQFTIISLILGMVFNKCFAEACPQPSALKRGEFSGWQVLELNDGMPVSAARLAQFQAEVDAFSLAEWMRAAPDGEAHCYYDGKISDASYLGVYLSKFNLEPKMETRMWQRLNEDVQQCQAPAEFCLWKD